MGFVSQEEINEIRSNADIVEIIGSYIPLTQKGKNYFCVCPFHDDHAPSMSVSSEKQIYKCFSCGATGNVFTFVQNYENVSFQQAISIVAEKIGMHISTHFEQKENTKYKKEYEIMSLAEKYYCNNMNTAMGSAAKKYLLERGLSEEIIKEFHIGLSLDEPNLLYQLLTKKGYEEKTLDALGLISKNSNGSSFDLFTRRILFPLWNVDGQVVGFSGRIYRGEDSSKYINTKETVLFRKGQTLYNYHRAKDAARKDKFLLVVEGQMDAIRLYSNGIKNVVALMGSALTKEQLQLLKKLRVPIYLCLDNDRAGQGAMLSIGEALTSENVEVNVVVLSGAKDPDEYILKNGLDAFQTCLRSPVSYFDFKINTLKKGKNLASADDLASYINELLEALSKEKDPIRKEVTLSKISEEYHLSTTVLKEKLESLEKKEEDKPTVVETLVENKPKKKTKYELAAEQILFSMMNDSMYIKMYLKQLGYLPTQKYREIASEILYYYDKNKTINVADFVTFETAKGNFIERINEIMVEYATSTLNEQEFLENVAIVKKESQKEEIKKLKEELKQEMDVNNKIRILEKLTNLKKGSV